MKDDEDLKRFIQAAQAPPQRLGSGFVINMPDGKGGINSVPVEAATVLLLDQMLSTLQQMLTEMKRVEVVPAVLESKDE